jgi:hypothetical protein
MSSLSLFARRLSLTVAARGPAVVRTFAKATLTTEGAKKISETLANKPTADYYDDTVMHDQFRILEDMLEKNLHNIDEEEVEELRQLIKTAPKTFAVDAPDGETDGHWGEEMKEVNAILEDVAAHKDEIKARLSKLKEMMKENQKIFAVDSPDGEDDGHLKEELEEINHIIEDAAEHEDKEKIEYQHKMEDAVRKERARDPEHDW